jgi:hypothetical protein
MSEMAARVDKMLTFDLGAATCSRKRGVAAGPALVNFEPNGSQTYKSQPAICVPRAGKPANPPSDNSSDEYGFILSSDEYGFI